MYNTTVEQQLLQDADSFETQVAPIQMDMYVAMPTSLKTNATPIQ